MFHANMKCTQASYFVHLLHCRYANCTFVVTLRAYVSLQVCAGLATCQALDLHHAKHWTE